MTDGVDIRDAVRTPQEPPLVPGRLRRPLVHVVPEAMPGAWCAELSRWLFEHRMEMVTMQDERRVAHDLQIGDKAPALMAQLRATLLAQLPAAIEACAVSDFDLTGTRLIASLMHRHCFADWVAGATDGDARICFELTMHTDPPMFSGGEVEFLNGDTIAPANAQMLWLHPLQPFRIREVECWSNHALDGRWSIWGALCGPEPAGWADLRKRLQSS